MLRKNSGESISYPFAFGIEGLSNLEIHLQLGSMWNFPQFPQKFCKFFDTNWGDRLKGIQERRKATPKTSPETPKTSPGTGKLIDVWESSHLIQ